MRRFVRRGAGISAVSYVLLVAGSPAGGQVAAGVQVALPPMVEISRPGEVDAQFAIDDKTGWWYRLNGPQEGEPASPIRTVIPPGQSAPTTVPASAIAAGTVGGQPDKVAAVGVVIDDPPGTTVLAMTMTIAESTANGANQNSGTAKVFACPITGFWAPSQRGNWIDRPAADCSLGRVDGARAANGTWTFDLTSLGALWLSSAGGLSQNGVRLDVDPASGQAVFQVSWEPSSLQFSLLSTPPSTSAPPPPSSPFEAVVAEAFGGEIPLPLAAALPPAPAPLPSVVFAEPARGAIQLPEPNIFGDLPWVSVFLVPFMLGVALVVAYGLGPAGDPESAQHREGSVSRALARREAASRGSTT